MMELLSSCASRATDIATPAQKKDGALVEDVSKKAIFRHLEEVLKPVREFVEDPHSCKSEQIHRHLYLNHNVPAEIFAVTTSWVTGYRVRSDVNNRQ